MSTGLTEQAEQRTTAMLASWSKPWGKINTSRRWTKTVKHRRERRRAKQQPECFPQYRRYAGWEW